MTDRQVQEHEPAFTYQVRLGGTSQAALRRQFPRASVCAMPTETVLFSSLDEPAALDALIDQLLSMGLVHTELHARRRPHWSVSASEVRVRGVLANQTLRHLGWSHRVVTEQTVMRIEATPAELHELLRTCSDGGLSVERVVRLGDATRARTLGISRDRGRDLDGPPRVVG